MKQTRSLSELAVCPYIPDFTLYKLFCIIFDGNFCQSVNVHTIFFLYFRFGFRTEGPSGGNVNVMVSSRQ